MKNAQRARPIRTFEALTAGKTALVTGASAGIGAGFAEALAARGLHLVLIARRKDRLDTLASSLTARFGVRAEAFAADLATQEGIDAITGLIAARSVDVLVNNAGFGTAGWFDRQDPEREAREIALNVGAVVALTRAALPGMSARRCGAIVNVASTAAFQGVPYMAVYGATKAFVLSFSTALHEEVSARGIRVTTLCPGPTVTEFFDVMQSDTQFGPSRSVEQVVATGLRAIERGRIVAVDGPLNAIAAVLPRIFPRSMTTAVTGFAMRPRPERRRG